MKNQKRFNAIVKDITNIKIQGARSIAKAALYAYSLNPTQSAKKKLLSLRPTEPMLQNVLERAGRENYKEIMKQFDSAQNKINNFVFKLIKNNSIIFTHCHSTNVVKSLIYSKSQGKKFQVYNTETRPLYQGRKTSLELEKAGIKVTMFIDSALDVALKDASMIFLGADAILKKGIINKIGSGMIAELSRIHKIPLYIIADSWKYSPRNVPIEQRKLNEVWNRAPKHILIKNPAFEFVHKKHIKAVVSELGILSYDKFLKHQNSTRL